MSAFYRVLRTSAPARYGLYATAGAGTYYATWKWHQQSRNKHVPHENISTKTGSSPSMHESLQRPAEDLLVKKVEEALVTQPSTSKDPVPPPPEDPLSPVVVEGGQGEGEPKEEDANTGAYDPVTGEINWDCPCLGGMAHGPCGPQFREAFSCFVYSEAEPKGIDCVEKFRMMQDCFREHPEVYAEELKDDGDDDESDIISTETSPPSTPPPSGGEGLEIPPPQEPGHIPPKEDLIKGPISPPPLPPSDAPKPPPPLPPSPRPNPPPPLPRPRPRGPTIADPPSQPIGAGIPGTTVSSGTKSSP